MFVKNKLLFTGAGLLLLLSMAACKHKEPDDLTPPAERVSLLITAEQIESRTVVGEAQASGIPILWEATDEIWVRSAKQEEGTPGDKFETAPSAISEGGRVATFIGETLDAGPYVAVYPYSLVAQGSDNEKVVLNVPGEQSYVSNSFAHNANLTAAVWENGTHAKFKNVAGSLRLRLNGHTAVSKIVLADKDPSFPLVEPGGSSGGNGHDHEERQVSVLFGISLLFGQQGIGVEPLHGGIFRILQVHEAHLTEGDRRGRDHLLPPLEG